MTQSRGERAALRYAQLGWRVLPLHTPDRDGACSCGLKDCPKPGKHPRTRHGVRDASASVSAISSSWANWPDANVGLATGALLVVDVDGADGARALRQLAREQDLPVTSRPPPAGVVTCTSPRPRWRSAIPAAASAEAWTSAGTAATSSPRQACTRSGSATDGSIDAALRLCPPGSRSC